jgi:hypothetical protein
VSQQARARMRDGSPARAHPPARRCARHDRLRPRRGLLAHAWYGVRNGVTVRASSLYRSDNAKAILLVVAFFRLDANTRARLATRHHEDQSRLSGKEFGLADDGNWPNLAFDE